jgi:2-polyprenyl-3-methyl-5-hydroxy-6-metoxy-1,4-benzoquinol methylase
MPNSVQQHYANLLAEHYDGMFGVPFETKVAEQKDLLESVTGIAAPGSFAIDLGCGSGFQSLALSELGFDVLAIDTSERLLGALRGRLGGRRIEVKGGDLLEIESFAPPQT